MVVVDYCYSDFCSKPYSSSSSLIDWPDFACVFLLRPLKGSSCLGESLVQHYLKDVHVGQRSCSWTMHCGSKIDFCFERPMNCVDADEHSMYPHEHVNSSSFRWTRHFESSMITFERYASLRDAEQGFFFEGEREENSRGTSTRFAFARPARSGTRWSNHGQE